MTKLFGEEFLGLGDDVFDLDHSELLFVAELPFDFAVHEALLADGDAHRRTPQVGVLELHARTFVAVVHEHVDAGGFEFLFELLGEFHEFGFLADRDDFHLERSDGLGPNRSEVIVTVFHDRGHQAAHADAVAAHDGGSGGLFGGEELGAHRFRELGAEFEDVAHFDAASFCEEFAAAGALADFGSFGDVGHFELREVALRVAMLEVVAFFVRARHEVEGIGNRFVHDDAGVVSVDRGSKARNHAAGLDEAVFGRIEFLRLEQVVELDFGNVEVARNHDRDELAFEVEEHALGGGFGRHVQELGDFFDAFAVRRSDLFESGIFVALERHALELGDFAVGLVAALLAENQVVFTVRSVEHKFVSDLTAHDTRIALHHHWFNAHATVNAEVGVVFFLVVTVQVFLAGVEAVGILHQEFADADKAAAGTSFVTVLGLELVEHHRQLLVAVEHVAHEVGHGFFVGHGEHHVVVVAVLEAEQFFANGLVTARFAPEFGSLHHRQIDLDTADLVHFFADDVHDLLDHAETHRHHGVDTGRDGLDVAAAHEEDVGGHGGIARRFAERHVKVLGEFHCFCLLKFYGVNVEIRVETRDERRENSNLIECIFLFCIHGIFK